VINVSRRSSMPATVVMEVKCSVTDLQPVARLLATVPVPLTRHSKYCNAVSAIEGY
jgi:hypothetical protein